jgi:branched-chain amino acid transport system ATP-binding protein
MLLDVKNLNSSYGKLEILKGISITVSDNEIVGIIGANGAGKTTLLRAISGFVKATQGQIMFNGQRVNDLNPDTIVKIGIAQVPEGKQLFPKMSVLENMELGAFLRKDKKEIKKDIYEWIFILFPILRERMYQLAGTLSGGEQQMLAIARGLMSRPKLFMLDEPSLGLAPMVVEALFVTIKEIVKKGLATILVEQNTAMALNISNRAYVLETGQIVLDGASHDLINNPHVKKAYLGL